MSLSIKNKPSTPESYVHDFTLPSFEQEVMVLQWFKDNFTTNPKKLKALARRIRPLIPDYMQTSLCDEIRDSADPVAWMQRNFIEIGSLYNTIENYVATGHHGMIYNKDVLHGLKLEVSPKWISGKDTERWTEEQELEIMGQALKAWMIENNRVHHRDRVLLFQRFGFSGVSHVMEYTLTEAEWNKAQARAEERRKEKKAAELKALMKVALEKNE